jgi:hypothetical protein
MNKKEKYAEIPCKQKINNHSQINFEEDQIFRVMLNSK